MSIAGVEGNITYTTTCLERERNDEEELKKQVQYLLGRRSYLNVIFLAFLSSINWNN